MPHLKRPPSEYIREHFWFTTQPIEEPHQPDEFRQLLDDLGMNDRLMFSTDYPHWDFDAPDQAIPPGLPPDAACARSWPRTRGRSTGSDA